MSNTYIPEAKKFIYLGNIFATNFNLFKINRINIVKNLNNNIYFK